MTFVPGEDGVVTDFVVEVNAGEDLTTNDAVYIDASDGEAYKCDADDLAKIGFAGFVVADATNGNTVRILPWGIKGGFTGLTPNAVYYLSGTAGEITSTRPTNFKMAAKAISATVVRIITEPTVRVRTYVGTTDTWVKPAGFIKALVQVQAAGGGSGTCSNSQTAAGGGGAYTEGWLYDDDLAATVAVDAGEGGVGGVKDVTDDATDGGDSSFGTHLVAGGGVGSVQNGAIANGGTVTTPGHIEIDGGPGRQGISNDNGSSQAAYNYYAPGMGHLSVWVPPLRESGNDSDFYGPSGVGYGHGGRAIGQDSQPNDISGEDGADGIIIVTEYY